MTEECCESKVEWTRSEDTLPRKFVIKIKNKSSPNYENYSEQFQHVTFFIISKKLTYS